MDALRTHSVSLSGRPLRRQLRTRARPDFEIPGKHFIIYGWKERGRRAAERGPEPFDTRQDRWSATPLDGHGSVTRAINRCLTTHSFVHYTA